MLFKKGDSRLPENCRPIALVRIVYKVFTKLLAGRMEVVLDCAQSPDQAGFRSGFSVDDNLFTMAVLVEKASEFNLPLWTCAIDFKWAFDMVFHVSS